MHNDVCAFTSRPSPMQKRHVIEKLSNWTWHFICIDMIVSFFCAVILPSVYPTQIWQLTNNTYGRPQGQLHEYMFAPCEASTLYPILSFSKVGLLIESFESNSPLLKFELFEQIVALILCNPFKYNRIESNSNYPIRLEALLKSEEKRSRGANGNEERRK